MSFDQLSIEPRAQFISQLVLAVFQIRGVIFVARLERNALPSLLGLIYTVDDKTQGMLKDVTEDIERYIDTGEFVFKDVWRVYKQTLWVLNKRYLHDLIFGIVPASAPAGGRDKPSAKKYDPKMSDQIE